MKKEERKRNYSRTSFYLFLLCIIISLFSTFSGIKVEDMITHTKDFIQKTYTDMNTLWIFVWPLATMAKEAWTDYLDHKKELKMLDKNEQA